MATHIAFITDPGRRRIKVSHAAIRSAGLVDDLSARHRDRTPRLSRRLK